MSDRPIRKGDLVVIAQDRRRAVPPDHPEHGIKDRRWQVAMVIKVRDGRAVLAERPMSDDFGAVLRIETEHFFLPKQKIGVDVWSLLERMDRLDFDDLEEAKAEFRRAMAGASEEEGQTS